MRNKENMMAWRKKHYKKIEFLLRKEEDKDMIDFLDSKPSRASYIIDVIRKDMKKSVK